MKNHPTVFLLSDSTVQSYETFYAPQTGWGQVFFENFKGSEQEHETPAENCSYPQGRAYHLPGLTIENRAIGGRSSRSFIEEGKLAEAAALMKPGDFVFIQFGHNDATPSRPARYVPAEHFADYLQIYADTCSKAGALCVFVTPVARRNCVDFPSACQIKSGTAEGSVQNRKDASSKSCAISVASADHAPADREAFHISFPEYRDEMIRFANENGLPLLDLGKKSVDYLNRIGPDASKKLYLHTAPGEYVGAYADGVTDNTHLSLTGARIYSRMTAELIRNSPQLASLKAFLR
ncbi:MAG: rhamnogalacturonan acetylesterase [Lachnospiraceae bacterium]|nr:rhamnogalacturonan acetylesterase [Lachnospiraceae bacterium]